LRSSIELVGSGATKEKPAVRSHPILNPSPVVLQGSDRVPFLTAPKRVNDQFLRP
jgi:hypothetical protein